MSITEQLKHRRIWTTEELDARWEAVRYDEREAFLRYGTKPAPWENPPDYARRILKGDPKLSLENAAKLDAIFRAAYEAMVAE